MTAENRFELIILDKFAVDVFESCNLVLKLLYIYTFLT